MDLRRLRAGEWLVALSGAVLLGSLFFPWYEGGASAWSALAVVDVVLALIAAAAVALLVITATQRVPAVPVALAALVAMGGLIAVLVVLFRIVDLPEGISGRDWGVWAALAGALGIVAGALVAIRDERPSPPGRHTDATGRPAPPPEELDPIPAARVGRTRS